MLALALREASSQQLLGMWKLRHFVVSLVGMDLRARYRHSSLGIGWSLLRPMANCAVLCLVFAKLFNVTMADYAPFLLIGVTTWQFLTETMMSGCQTFRLAASYIRQRDLPLAIFPLRTTLSTGFHSLIALLLALLITWAFRGLPSPLALVSLLPSLLLFFLLGWSLALLFGIVHCYFPDTQYLLEICLQLLFYLSPIMYPPEAFLARGHVTMLLQLNPISYFLELIRSPILQGQLPSTQAYLVCSGTVVVLMMAAYLALLKVGRRIVFYI